MIEFAVPIAPVPKGRPRFSRGRTYTPAETLRFERQFAAAAAKHRPAKPLDGPLEVNILCQLLKPRTVKREFPSVKPDLDNYVKAVLDALKGFWRDDAQITHLFARKRYGDTPLIKVEIDRPGPEGFAEGDL